MANTTAGTVTVPVGALILVGGFGLYGAYRLMQDLNGDHYTKGEFFQFIDRIVDLRLVESLGSTTPLEHVVDPDQLQLLYDHHGRAGLYAYVVAKNLATGHDEIDTMIDNVFLPRLTKNALREI